MTQLLNQTIGGRPATLAFLTSSLKPTSSPENASVVKIMFQDDRGGSMFVQNVLAREATGAYDSARGLGVDSDDPVARVMRLLEGRLLPGELEVVRQMLEHALIKPAASVTSSDPTGLSAEDQSPFRRRSIDVVRARLAFDSRYPEAARIGVEPDYATPRRKPSAGAISDFEARFPDAKRIGDA